VIILIIRQGGSRTQIEVPDGSQAKITADGKVEVTLPEGQGSDRKPASTPPAAGVAAAKTALTSQSRDFTGQLADTVWEVTDSDGDRYRFHFQDKGVLHYEAARGPRANGTWVKTGTEIHIETNSQYATMDGGLANGVLSGKGSSQNGRSWTWRAVLK
jgi:hypothetical protein